MRARKNLRRVVAALLCLAALDVEMACRDPRFVVVPIVTTEQRQVITT